METKNLRIGNWVKIPIKGSEVIIPSFNAKVQSIGLFGMIGFLSTPEHEGLKWSAKTIIPIRLTTEWLMELGFKKQSNTYIISLYNLKAELHFEDYGKNIVLWLKSNNSNLRLDTVQYVHQLQNLFFTLSNKELELKNDYSTCC